MLSHADRSRIIPDARPVPLPPGNGAACCTVLIDGWYAADWRVCRATGLLTIVPFRPRTTAQRDEVIAEGARLVSLAMADIPKRQVDIAGVP
ncbi:DNA glycosylase AlkZ-like family protein [Amycolatopsis plumensis]|uniref:DNA glycosylase AlkZ-like family protein n=1 Tax=Amycolatopsis plumensis TaxID=236508 RepID=A0ABV5U8R5_9PSEU